MGLIMDTQNTSATASTWSAVIVVVFDAFALVTSESLPVGLLPQIAHDLRITFSSVQLGYGVTSFIGNLIGDGVVAKKRAQLS
jgi:predicted MFS family arabinose efflux permease